MNTTAFARLLSALVLLFSTLPVLSAQQPAAAPAPGAPAAEAQPRSPAWEPARAILRRINVKLKDGERSLDRVAGELAELDALLKQHPEKNEDNARIAEALATYRADLSRDEDLARRLYAAVVNDYPGTKASESASKSLHRLSPEYKAAQAAAKAEHAAKVAALIGRPAPEINFTWSSREGLAKLSDLRGQVVVLDFWATWCAPCIASFPKIRREVEHFKGSPVVILGVTSLQGRVSNLEKNSIDVKDDPAREHALTADFMKKHDMTWPVAFSTQNVFNPDYAVRGIPSIAIIAPDGTVRHANIFPHDPKADVEAKVTAILKEFNLRTPDGG